MDSRKFKNIILWLATHVTEFLIVAWFFLGSSPIETYHKAVHQLTSYKYMVANQFHLFFDASSRLGDKANKYGLNEAKNVREGRRDNYQHEHMKMIDDEINKNLNR